jgi:ubiquinol-cytochrome c reductase iron-sulfur subunit
VDRPGALTSEPTPPSRAQSERRAERLVGGCFTVTALSALALAGVFIRGGQPQLEGTLLGLALGGLGIGFILWGKLLLPHAEITEDRKPLRSTSEVRAGFDDALERAGDLVPRRSFLTRTLMAALGALGLAALFPIRSLGPSPGRSLFTTAWRPGKRLVKDDGSLVRLGELAVGGVLTVFPEGFTERDKADSQTILIRVEPERIKEKPGREGWTKGGHIAYSKVCTHAGCPVGLFQTQTGHLLCPCHQSTFDALDAARPIFGPATRSLPQLPLDVDAEGYLIATADYDEAVGPAFWERP